MPLPRRLLLLSGSLLIWYALIPPPQCLLEVGVQETVAGVAVRNRREVLKLGLLAGFGVAGCQPPPSVKLVENSIEAISPKGGFGVSPDWIEQLPMPSMGVELAGQGRFVSVLASTQNLRQAWVSADKQIFITDRGRLVATRGLERDLLATRWRKPDPLLMLRGKGRHLPAQVYRWIDLKAGKNIEKNVPVESEFASVADEILIVHGQSRQTTRVREITRMRDWFWETEEFFWVDRKLPIIWRSQQCYCPEVGAIGLELLRDPTPHTA